MKHIVYSALQTPDGTIIESKHRHDYVTHHDKNDKEYMIDGGHDELKWTSGHGDEKFILVYDDDPFEEVRKVFKWVCEKQYIKLMEITNDHLEALCNYDPAPDWCKKLFKKEKQFRELANNLI